MEQTNNISCTVKYIYLKYYEFLKDIQWSDDAIWWLWMHTFIFTTLPLKHSIKYLLKNYHAIFLFKFLFISIVWWAVSNALRQNLLINYIGMYYNAFRHVLNVLKLLSTLCTKCTFLYWFVIWFRGEHILNCQSVSAILFLINMFCWASPW